MYNLIYDATYYLLAGVFASGTPADRGDGPPAATSRSDGELRIAAVGLGWAGLGTLVALVAGVGLDLLSPLTGDLLYQQLHFTIFYLGFALVLHGLETLAWPADASPSSRRLRWLGRAAFAVAVAVAALFLFNPASYTVSGHHVAQQTVFYLPLVVVLLLGAIVPTAIALHGPMSGPCVRRGSGSRPSRRWHSSACSGSPRSSPRRANRWST